MILEDKQRNHLTQNIEFYRKQFPSLEYMTACILGTYSLRCTGKVSEKEIAEVTKQIKKRAGLLSPFRKQLHWLTCLISAEHKDYQMAINRLFEHEQYLKQARLSSKQNLVYSCYFIDRILYDKDIQDMNIQTRNYRETLISKAERAKNKIPKSIQTNSPPSGLLALAIGHAGINSNKLSDTYQALISLGLKDSEELFLAGLLLNLSGDRQKDLIDNYSELIKNYKLRQVHINRKIYHLLALCELIANDKNYLNQINIAIEQLKKMDGPEKLSDTKLFCLATIFVLGEVKQDLSSKTIFETTLSLTIEEFILAETTVLLSLL